MRLTLENLMPDQDDMLKENSADSQSKASGKTSGLGSRFSFGSIYQKTLGRVLKSGQDKQVHFIFIFLFHD